MLVQTRAWNICAFPGINATRKGGEKRHGWPKRTPSLEIMVNEFNVLHFLVEQQPFWRRWMHMKWNHILERRQISRRRINTYLDRLRDRNIGSRIFTRPGSCTIKAWPIFLIRAMKWTRMLFSMVMQGINVCNHGTGHATIYTFHQVKSL